MKSEPTTESAPTLALAEPASPPQIDYESVRAARLFRAALRDALDVALETLLKKIALDVLARELQIAPADVAALVARAVEEFGSQRILSVRVNPRDVDVVANLGLEPVADDALQPGDMRIELQIGTIDRTLETRVEAALDACIA
ncbi:MAG: hypothetical protein JO104_06145 [Candidatus Eremiobacteraeota bacterium]|nr:hypothetical protein [Candidatus Eremiobacteraeota bacterium]